jgi:hypothetical protein
MTNEVKADNRTTERISEFDPARVRKRHPETATFSGWG